MLGSAVYELLKEDKTKTGRVFITVLNIVNQTRNQQGQAASSDGFLLGFLFDPEDGGDASPKCRATPEFHGVTTQNTAFYILAALSTPNLIVTLRTRVSRGQFSG
jgi:hypothetical protein